MNEHVTQWLTAYHDGELHGQRLARVERHLQHCEMCQAELAHIRTLSTLLQDVPPAERRTTADQFVAQVGLRLPRQAPQSAAQKALGKGWGWIPVGLLGLWALIQTTLVVANIILTALNLGLGGETLAGMIPATGTSWFTAFAQLPDASLSEVIRFLGYTLISGGPFGILTVINVVTLIVIALAYLSWIATWIARVRHVPNGAQIHAAHA